MVLFNFIMWWFYLFHYVVLLFNFIMWWFYLISLCGDFNYVVVLFNFTTWWLLLHPLLFWRMGYHYPFLKNGLFFFQSLLSISATGLLVTQHIVDIWQNFGYGLLVKWRKKYLCIRNVLTFWIILRWNSWK